jgi:hypothetical protein
MTNVGAELVVERGEEAGRVIPLAGPAVVIGRGGVTAGERVALAEADVSRQHARMEWGVQGWTVTDLGSTNGTQVNGERLAPHEPHALRPGDRLGLGGATLVLRRAEGGEPPQARVERAGSSQPRAEGAEAASPRAGRARGRPRPAVLAVGALVLVLVLAGLVVLLVVLLRPDSSAVVTPTVGNPMEQVMTALPVPTELQDVATAVLPLIPTALAPLLGPQGTATP